MQKVAPTRLLFIIPTLAFGGAERVVITLLRHFDRTKFTLSLAVVDTRNAAFLNDIPDDVEFIDLKVRRVRLALPQIVALLRRRRPDVVFSTLGHLNLALSMIKWLLPRETRLMGRESSIVSIVNASYSWPALWNWAYRTFYGHLDRIVCQSDGMLEDLARNIGVGTARMIKINNPVDIDRIRHLSKEKVPVAVETDGAGGGLKLVAAGRLVPTKGFDILLRAMALCGDLRPQLTLLGSGPQEDELKLLSRSLGVAGQVLWAGYQANPYPFLVRADAFVLSSRHEGFPNVVLEALACGTPVIAVPAPGGTREIVSRVEQCELAEEVSAEALANAMRQWSARRPGRVPDEAVRPYALGDIVDQYESEILSVAAV